MSIAVGATERNSQPARFIQNRIPILANLQQIKCLLGIVSAVWWEYHHAVQSVITICRTDVELSSKAIAVWNPRKLKSQVLIPTWQQIRKAPVSYVSKNFEIKRHLHPIEYLQVKYKRNVYLLN